MFSSSGHQTKPAGGTLESYWKCYHSGIVKSIVNTEFVVGPVDPHTFVYKDGMIAVGEDFLPINGSRRAFSMEYVVLNHYVLRSWAEFTAKILRGSGDGGHKSLNFFYAIDAAAKANCTYAVELMKGRTWQRDLPSIEWARTLSPEPSFKLPMAPSVRPQFASAPP